MSVEPFDRDSDLEKFRYWKPEVQRKALALIHQYRAKPWKPFYCPNPSCTGQPHCWPEDPRPCESIMGWHEWFEDSGRWFCPHCEAWGDLLDGWDFPHARADQRPPPWRERWLTWFLASGRGSGKTESGARLTHKATEHTPRIILVAPTGPDLRATMVEGISGLLATAKPGQKPEWEPSKKQLTWPNGAIAQGFSAEEPDRLRGPQSGFIWMDEPAHYEQIEKVWDNALFGLRVRGRFPGHVCATTTPIPVKWVKDTVADKRTRLSRTSTYANLRNLDENFRETVLNKYEGTRVGQQELHGEILMDVEGALWTWEMFHRIEEAPVLERIIVAVDPAGTADRRSDETGIIVMGCVGNLIYVLADETGKYSPATWGNRVVAVAEHFAADMIVAEKNYGGDMVKHVLDSVDGSKNFRLKLVTSRRGKLIRAEPIVALYEKQLVVHVGRREDWADLEDEQTSWVPGKSASPNRVDALVHGATELAKTGVLAGVASPARLLQKYRSPTPQHSRRLGGLR